MSVVPMGADAGASFRAATFPYHEETHPWSRPPPQRLRPRRSLDTERARTTGILSAVRAARLEMALAEQMIADGTPLEAARGQVFEQLIARQDAGGPREGPSGVVQPRRDLASDFRAAACDGLLLRAGVLDSEAARGGAGLPRHRVHELARICLLAAPASRIACCRPSSSSRARMSTGLPAHLAGRAREGDPQRLRNGAGVPPRVGPHGARPGFQGPVAPDPGLGAEPPGRAGRRRVHSTGRWTRTAPATRIAKYGRIVALNWEVLVNDDFNAFLRVQPALGQAARRLEADTVYALLALAAGAGPLMQDGVTLFHASHNNLTSSGAFDALLLGAGRSLLRKQQRWAEATCPSCRGISSCPRNGRRRRRAFSPRRRAP